MKIYQGRTKTGRNIIVRYPNLSDLNEMLRYINELSREKTFITYQGEQETLESEAQFLNSKLKGIRDKTSILLLVINNKKVIATAGIDMHDKTQNHVGVLGISIAKNFRGDGIGKLLMDLIIKEAKKKIAAIKIVTLNVYSTNSIARNLYKKIGFIEYGILPKGIIRGGKFEDTILMYKNI
jgi:RimJ/RimL family protein N-acetyltransferase